MNIKKIIAASICAALLPCCIAGCAKNDNSQSSEASDMNSSADTGSSSSTESALPPEEKEIPVAKVNAAYKRYR